MLEVVTILYIALSLVATIVIVRSDHLERSQSIYQSCAVWLVPFVGAVFILVFHTVVHTNMTVKAGPDRVSKNTDDIAAYDLYKDLD